MHMILKHVWVQRLNLTFWEEVNINKWEYIKEWRFSTISGCTWARPIPTSTSRWHCRTAWLWYAWIAAYAVCSLLPTPMLLVAGDAAVRSARELHQAWVFPAARSASAQALGWHSTQSAIRVTLLETGGGETSQAVVSKAELKFGD